MYLNLIKGGNGAIPGNSATYPARLLLEKQSTTITTTSKLLCKALTSTWLM